MPEDDILGILPIYNVRVEKLFCMQVMQYAPHGAMGSLPGNLTESLPEIPSST